MRELVKSFLDWYVAALDAGGYPLIAFLMALESSIVPLPSEVVIPPAAHVAHTRGTMSLSGIVIAGTVGSWLGATAMYWAARLLGRPLLMRYGRYLLVTPEKIEQAEIWSERFGTVGIFISRLLPVIRHLIGIPAGIVRMDYLRFSAATVVGSALWCGVLAWVGVTMGQDQELMAGNLHRISLWIGGLMLFLGALYYFFVHRYMRR
jgi:membrane protein DedA with SNARE-associated domain